MNNGSIVRAVRPESNINLDTDMLLLEQKKEKCLEIIRNSSLIHDLLSKAKNEYSVG